MAKFINKQEQKLCRRYWNIYIQQTADQQPGDQRSDIRDILFLNHSARRSFMVAMDLILNFSKDIRFDCIEGALINKWG